MKQTSDQLINFRDLGSSLEQSQQRISALELGLKMLEAELSIVNSSTQQVQTSSGSGGITHPQVMARVVFWGPF